MTSSPPTKTTFLPFLGLVLVILFWLSESALDVHLFKESDTYLEALFFCEPMELWMRIAVATLIMAFSFYAQYVLNKQRFISEQLEEENAALGQQVALRIEAEKKLEYQAYHDMLTGLYNRRKFDEILNYEIERASRYQGEMTLAFCDLDFFKSVNDNHGHEIGDKILKLFSDKLKESVRETDVVARWGGEEFIILLLNTASDQSERMASALREKIESSEFQSVGHITVSIGITHFLQGDNQQTLLDRADKALHLAKENGRNRVEVVIA